MDARAGTYRSSDLTQFFSFEGRVRRSTFWINTLAFGVLSWMLQWIFVDTYLSPYSWELETHISNKPFYYLIGLVLAVRQVSITVRRWHDIEKEGAWALLGLAPVMVALFPTLATPASEFGQFMYLIMALVTMHAFGMQGYVQGNAGRTNMGHHHQRRAKSFSGWSAALSTSVEK